MDTQPAPGGPSSPPAVAAAENVAVDHQQWKTEPIRIGRMGIQLNSSLAFLKPNEAARLTNLVPRNEGGVITRPGQTTFLTTGGSAVLSACRLDDPNDADTTIFWSVDQSVMRGTSGVPSNIASGFSGKPISFTPWQASQSGEPWVYMADEDQMAKASRTSPALPIGLPKAAQPSSVTPAARLVTSICTFSATDNTQAANWTPFNGPDADPEGGVCGVPVLYDASGVDPDGCVNMATVEGTAITGYICSMSIPKPMDLSLVGGQPSTEEDIISFALRINTPRQVKEVRLYFVCSAFTPGAIPGGEPNKVIPAGANANAYVRSLRSSDYAEFIGAQGTAQEAASNVRSSNLLSGFADPATLSAATVSSASLAGSDTWTQYGSITEPTNPSDPTIRIPLRKRDFVRIGTAGQPGTDWSTITGIVIAVITKNAVPVTLGFDNAYLTGGYNPDTSEPDSQPFDYRIVNVDKRTGARSNPSDVLESQKIEALRQQVTIQPAAYGDANIYQIAYRRGGSLVDNWYNIGDNYDTGDGQTITDNSSDASALGAGAVETDNDQPVTTADANGDAVYASPLSFLVGPLDGFLIGGGDRHRPGDIYWCKRSQPDHWPAANHTPCCPPSEQLLNGAMFASQAFVFSHVRMYQVQVNLSDSGSLSTSPTDCLEGLAGRMALAVGPGGIFFASDDAVRVTQGGVSKVISNNIRPLFHGESVNGYNPIDFDYPDQIRLQVHGDDLWFGFQDTAGDKVWWVYSIIYETWRFVEFARATTMVYSDSGQDHGLLLILGGASTGNAYHHTGFTDDGTPITTQFRTGALLSESREEKIFGDLMTWGNFYGADLEIQPLLNNEVTEDLVSSVTTATGYQRQIFHPFGTQPQHAQSISVDVAWEAPNNASPYLDMVGISVAIQPEITMKRATQWHPLRNEGESWVQGAWVDSDTFGNDVVVDFEGLLNGTPVTLLADQIINSNAGRKQWYSWPAKHVDMVRIRPTGDCEPWMLFGQGWLSRPEPARVSKIDSGYENHQDSYYTGLDIEIDTFGQDKQIIVTVDDVVLFDPATGFGYWTVNANSRRLIHLTLPDGRGHIYRFYSSDSVLALVYSHKWWLDAEPSEQANWNQNYTIAGSLADKWLKGILLECDTFGQNKSVNVQIDGVNVAAGPFTVNTNGRKVVHVAFPEELGRVFRVWPADAFPGRLYSLGWIFDEEPYQLTRFETQEITLGIDAWKMATYGEITYKAASDVTITCKVYGHAGNLIATDAYTLPATGSLKTMTPFKPLARKGVLYKYIFTSPTGFWLYREESWIKFQPWLGGAATKLKPFGNDDLDPTRSMVNAEGAAARSGGLANG